MKAILLCALAIVAVASAQVTYNSNFDIDETFQAFTDYVSNFEKKYASVEEFLERYVHFKESVERIAALNGKSKNQVYGLNKFSDMSPQEFKATYLGSRPTAPPKAKVRRSPILVRATSVDWRTKGAVTPVKDQGQCGSCWAFSATEEIESMYILANNTAIELAPQQIVSCDTTDYGCGGGWTTDAFNYVATAGGIEPDSDYPYTSGASGDSGTCSVNTQDFAVKLNSKSAFSYATPPCTSGSTCTNQDEGTMQNNCAATGPVSVCVNAATWQDYSGGVLTSNCPSDYNDLDHCVQVVGFNTDSTGQKYWIVRNSWNTSWGDQGYIYIAIGSNLCGIADLATFAEIA